MTILKEEAKREKGKSNRAGLFARSDPGRRSRKQENCSDFVFSAFRAQFHI